MEFVPPEGTDPATVHAVDQKIAKFKDLTTALCQELIRDPKDLDPVQFTTILGEGIDSYEDMVSYLSFILGRLLAQEMISRRLGDAMSVIQQVVVDSMADKEVQAKFQQVLQDYHDRESLFEDQIVYPSGQEEPSESYTTGTGQVLHGVHRAGTCVGFCIIHNPITGPWNGWPTTWDAQQHVMWQVCPHGEAHPTLEDFLRSPVHLDHECDGCPCGPTYANSKLMTALHDLKESDEKNSTDPDHHPHS